MTVPNSCASCEHLRTYDWHYHYCAKHPDEKPELRPGGGKQIWGPIEPPPADCPLRTEVTP